MDLKQLEHQLEYPRDEIVANVIVYVSLCKLLASQNLKDSTLESQTKFLEGMRKGGVTFDQLRNVFPLLRFETRKVLDKIFNSSIDTTMLASSLDLNQFMKCAGVLKCGSFEQKVNILLDVITTSLILPRSSTQTPKAT